MTNNDLIKINKDSRGVETVNARDLWIFIESKQEFSNWIKTRIRDYNFENGNDFIVIDNIVKNSNGGRPSIEYHISIDMAKELSMVERNKKGKEIRQWFIERENKLKNIEIDISNPPLLPDFNDPVAAARAWADAKEEELKTKLELQEAQPKIEFYETVGDAEGLYTIGEAAKVLGTGRNRLFAYLRENKIFFNTQPYQKYIDAGYFEVKANTIRFGAVEKINRQSFITPKGLQWLEKKLKN